MNGKKILGIALVIVGVMTYLFAGYIADQVTEGKSKIAKAEKTVSTTKEITSLSPYTKDLGNMATAPAEKKINQGKEDVSTYSQIANWLHIIGIVLFLIGILFILITFLNKTWINPL